MQIKTLFANHDYACRTDKFGGIKSLTVDLIQKVCATCPARMNDRTCCRNIVTVEKKLAKLNDTPPTTRKCARENCERHVLITPENQDVVTLVCEWCVAREADELKRTICSIPGCQNQGFKGGICQPHYWARRGGRPCRAVGGCKNKPVSGSPYCEHHLAERMARPKRIGHSVGSFGFDVFARH